MTGEKQGKQHDPVQNHLFFTFTTKELSCKLFFSKSSMEYEFAKCISIANTSEHDWKTK